MRNAFADEVKCLAAEDHRVILLSGDIGNRLFDGLRTQSPNQFLNCGIAEANMMSVAAGMALSGMKPIVYTITPFTTTRCYEQIRVDVAYHQAPVIIVGTGSGLSYAELGATHHSLEDLAIMRCLPGMQVLAPCDATELRFAMRAALKSNHPTYIRIGKKGEPDFYSDSTAYQIGKFQLIKPGHKIILFSVGTIISEVNKAAQELMGIGFDCQIVNVGTVKPLDLDFLSKISGDTNLLVTIEEHGLIGGFGSALLEYLSDRDDLNVPLLRLGTSDYFLHEVGGQEYARQIFGLDAKSIAAKIRNKLKII